LHLNPIRIFKICDKNHLGAQTRHLAVSLIDSLIAGGARVDDWGDNRINLLPVSAVNISRKFLNERPWGENDREINIIGSLVFTSVPEFEHIKEEDEDLMLEDIVKRLWNLEAWFLGQFDARWSALSDYTCYDKLCAWLQFATFRRPCLFLDPNHGYEKFNFNRRFKLEHLAEGVRKLDQLTLYDAFPEREMMVLAALYFVFGNPSDH
jgi:hypothetical protein